MPQQYWGSVLRKASILACVDLSVPVGGAEIAGPSQLRMTLTSTPASEQVHGCGVAEYMRTHGAVGMALPRYPAWRRTIL